MKKFLALLIMFSVCLAPVVGCGGDDKKDKDGAKKDAAAEKKDGEKDKDGAKKDS